jgi:pyruvate kinase
MSKLKTKIISTIGPATLDFKVFQNLIIEGTDYIRINTTYGNEKQYDTILNNLAKIKLKKETKIIWDIKKLDKLEYAIKHNIKTIAISFVENTNQIIEVKNLLPTAFVISKIETAQGVQNFNSILDASDGIMVARGDLGKAVSLEKVPPLQKEFTQKTIDRNKFLVTATEMLLSMVESPKPTRAEVSDVANAVFEHSSAVMLSEETAIGKYPIESVIMMKKVINEAENWLAKQN